MPNQTDEIVIAEAPRWAWDIIWRVLNVTARETEDPDLSRDIRNARHALGWATEGEDFSETGLPRSLINPAFKES